MIQKILLILLLIALVLVAPAQADETNNPAATAQAADATAAAAWGQATRQAEQATAQAIQITAQAQATAQAATSQAQATTQALEVQATRQALDTQATASALDAQATASAQQLAATAEAVRIDQERAIADLDRMKSERNQALQPLLLLGPTVLLLLAVAAIVWLVRRKVQPPIQVFEAGAYPEPEPEAPPRQPVALLPAASIETQAGSLQILAGPLPEVERSSRVAGEIEDLLAGAMNGEM